MKTNFSDFLANLRAELGCNTAKELFNRLGGSAGLEMELRNFMNLYSGKQLPSVHLLRTFFNVLPITMRKRLFISFFASYFTGDSENILEFIDIHLHETLARTEKTLWDDAPVLELSRQQIEFLHKDADILRTHHALLLYESIDADSVSNSVKNRLKSLVTIGLAKIVGSKFRNVCDLLIYPLRKGSAPGPTLRSSHELMVQSIRNYVQFEGDENQEIGFTVQLISPADRVAILNEGKRFKNWIQSLAAKSTDKDAIPLLWVSCLRTMTKKEFDL